MKNNTSNKKSPQRVMDPKDKRSEIVHFKVSARENLDISMTAKRCGMTVSSYVRARALGFEPVARMTIGEKDLITELGSGRNLTYPKLAETWRKLHSTAAQRPGERPATQQSAVNSKETIPSPLEPNDKKNSHRHGSPCNSLPQPMLCQVRKHRQDQGLTTPPCHRDAA